MANAKPIKDPEGLLRRLQTARKIFRIMFWIGLILLGLVILLAVLESELLEGLGGIVGVGAGLLLVLISVFGRSTVDKQMKNKLSVGIARAVLEEVMDRLDDYDPKATVSERFIKQEFGFPHYDRIAGGGDYIKGVYKGYAFQSSDFSLEEEEEKRDEEGNIRTEYKPVFNGRIIVCRHRWKLSGSFHLSQLTTYLGGVKTENETFNRLFSISAKDPHDVFYVLTPHYMEKLIQQSEALGKNNLFLRYNEDGSFLIVLRGYDFFEVGAQTDVAGIRASFVQQMEALGLVLDNLDAAKGA